MIDISSERHQLVIALYDVGQPDMLITCLEFIIEHGFVVTDGIPILVQIYPKPPGVYGDNFLARKKAVTTIEITG